MYSYDLYTIIRTCLVCRISRFEFRALGGVVVYGLCIGILNHRIKHLVCLELNLYVPACDIRRVILHTNPDMYCILNILAS